MTLLVGAVPVRKAFFGMGRSDQAILMDDVSCSGEEATIQSCSHMQSSDCDHSEDAGVICSGNFDVQTTIYHFPFIVPCIQGRALMEL